MLAPIITNNLPQIKSICETHHVKGLYVFGSAVTDKFEEESDIDFVIDFEGVEEKEFANNYFSLAETLQTLLKRRVDFVTEKYLRNRIFIEEVNNTKEIIYKA
jgi:predicted nucleotidyltransferase